jgi:hypothetical protein
MSSLTKKGLLAAADKAIIAARPALEIVKNFTIDFSADAVKPGTGVVVDVVKAAAEDFNATTANYGHATNSSTPVTVTTSIRKKSTFELTDLDALEDETGAALESNAIASGRAVGAELVKGVTGLFTAEKAAKALALGGVTLADFFALRGLVENEAIDPATCVMLLKPTEYSQLCSVLNAGIVGDGSVVRGAIIGAALGFKAIYSAPTVTLEGAGVVVPENAVAIVNRVVKPIKGTVGGLIEYGEHVDEVSQLVTTHRVIYNAEKGAAYWTHEGLFGAALTKSGTNGAPGFFNITK